MRKEFISESFSLGSAFYETSNIDEFYVSEDGLLGFGHLGELLYPLIFDLYDTHIWLNRAEWKILRRSRVGLDKSVEES